MIPQLERRLGKLEAKLKPRALRAVIQAYVDSSTSIESGCVRELVVKTLTGELRRKKGAIQKLIRPKAPSDHGRLCLIRISTAWVRCLKDWNRVRQGLQNDSTGNLIRISTSNGCSKTVRFWFDRI